jgi:hypothetical protein
LTIRQVDHLTCCPLSYDLRAVALNIPFARITTPPEPVVENGPGAADSSPHRYGFRRAVLGASAALHTIIPIKDVNTIIVHCQDPVNAYLTTHPTEGALVDIQLQSDNISQILKTHLTPHKSLSSISATPPETIDKIITGTAMRISFWTPESEVKVLQPVKFMAKYAAMAGAMRKRAIILPRLQVEAKVRLTAKAHKKPIWAPFKEKALPGIQGRRRGVTKDPMMSAPRYINAGDKLRDRAPCRLNACPLNPPIIKTRSRTIKDGFQAPTNSTGVKTNRSRRVKRIRLFSSLACRALLRNEGKS